MISGSPRLLHDGAALHHTMQQPWRYCTSNVACNIVPLAISPLFTGSVTDHTGGPRRDAGFPQENKSEREDTSCNKDHWDGKS
jgi:hypothetical protein